MQDKIEFIKEYIKLVNPSKREKPKKELFKDLLIRLYHNDQEARDIKVQLLLNAVISP